MPMPGARSRKARRARGQLAAGALIGEKSESESAGMLECRRRMLSARCQVVVWCLASVVCACVMC